MARTVKLEIDAKVTGLVNGLKTAQKATQDSAREFDKWAAKHEDSLETAGKGMAAFGLVAAGGATLAVKKFADFDKAMSSVQAATHESTTNMGLLRQAAIDTGADTAFSAAEAANGIEELAKAGVSTADVLGGGLTGALDLAAAGNLGVGESAEIAASAMTQFKLSGDQIPHLADLLAAGAGKAQGSVQDLGAALNQSGTIASSTGLSIEETTGFLAAFASAGTVGSDAGTSFKTMLMSLNPNSKEAAKLMDELGVRAYDAQGKFVGMSEYAGILQGALKGMSDEQRNATLKTLFGSDAVRAANVLYEQGAEGIQKWEGAVNDAGYAAETASIMQNNLAGDLEKLGGAFDTVFIQSGGAGNDVLRGFAQSLESVVDVVGKIPAPILGVGTIMAGVAGGAALLGAGVINVLPKLRDTHTALKDMIPAGTAVGDILRGTGKKASASALDFITIDAAMSKSEKNMRRVATAGRTIGKAAVGVGIAATAVTILGNATTKLDPTTVQDFSDAITQLNGIGVNSKLESVFSSWDRSVFKTAQDLQGLDESVKSIVDPPSGQAFNAWADKTFAWTGFAKSNTTQAKDKLVELGDAMGSLVDSGNAEAAASTFKEVAKAFEANGKGADVALASMPGYVASLERIAEAAGESLEPHELLEWAMSGIAPAAVSAASGTDTLAGALGEVGAEAEVVAASLDDILASLFELGRDTRSVIEAEDALTGSLKTLKDSVKENGKEFDGNSKAALANRAALVGVAADMESVIEAQARGGASSGEIAATMKGTYDAMMTATGGSEELVRSLLSIPPGVNVETYMDGVAKEIAAGTADAIEAIPGYKKVEIVVSEDGTVAQVQSKVNEVTGKTEYVLVSENGTTAAVQAGIANIKGKDVPVWVDDNGTVYSTSGKIQGIKGKDVTIVASAQTATAEAQLNNAARDRSSVINTRVVTTKVTHETTGVGGRGGITRASGGSVFGAGTETSDSIPAWLSNNEHVWTAKEVRNAGGHGAVERLRALARSGELPAFAKGGKVGAAEKKVTGLKRAYEKIDGKKDNKPRKLAAKWAYEDAKKELAAIKAGDKKAEAAAKKTSEARKKAAEDEKARQGRLGDSRRELGTDLRRGEITDAFTSGSGLGQIDKLYDASRNKDYSKSKRQGLARDAKALEKSLTILTKKSEGLKVALESATKQADELRSVRDSVAGDLRGEFSLSGMLGDARRDLGAAPVTARSIGQRANKMARNIEIFAGRLNRLRKMGYGETIIQEVAGLGTTDGTIVAGVLMNATKGEKSSIVKAYDRLDTASGKAGQYVTESMYKGGLDAADGLVKGLEAKTKTVEDAFYQLGKKGEKAFRKSLDMHSPSRTLAIAGGDAVDGSVLGVDRNRHKLESAMFGLGKAGEAAFDMQPAFSVPPSAEVARYAAQPAQSAGNHQQLAEAVGAAVHNAMSSYQPMVNIGGTKFYGVMSKAAHEARKPL